MKYGSLVLLAFFPVMFLTSSCKKTVIETKTVIDTVLIPSKDTAFLMDVGSWNVFSYSTLALVSPSPTTYITNAEGIKMFGQAYRLGVRLQTKAEVGFTNKTIYYKWKGNGGGGFADVVPQIKYDPFSNDGIPPIQGVDFSEFTFVNVFKNSSLIQNDIWYYTTAKHLIGSDNYLVTTCTGNYNNKGGTTVKSESFPVYTKHGYISIRIGDPYGGTNACLVVAECKIAD